MNAGEFMEQIVSFLISRGIPTDAPIALDVAFKHEHLHAEYVGGMLRIVGVYTPCSHDNAPLN